jgi:hypothetical protein
VNQRRVGDPNEANERPHAVDAGEARPAQWRQRNHVDGQLEIARARRDITFLGDDEDRRPAVAVEAAQEIHEAQLAAAHDGAVVRHDEDRRGRRQPPSDDHQDPQPVGRGGVEVAKDVQFRRRGPSRESGPADRRELAAVEHTSARACRAAASNSSGPIRGSGTQRRSL